MNAIDTNVLIYSLDRRDAVKQTQARTLLRRLRGNATATCIPWQVIGEFARQLRTWQDQGKLTYHLAIPYINGFRGVFPIVLPTMRVLDRALSLANSYSLSHWDSMLLGACFEAIVKVLFTEDMGAPTTIEGLRLISPFD